MDQLCSRDTPRWLMVELAKKAKERSRFYRSSRQLVLQLNKHCSLPPSSDDKVLNGPDQPSGFIVFAYDLLDDGIYGQAITFVLEWWGIRKRLWLGGGGWGGPIWRWYKRMYPPPTAPFFLSLSHHLRFLSLFSR